jgi:hypothetical protein
MLFESLIVMMMGSSFRSDKEWGDYIELVWANWLHSHTGGDTFEHSNGRVPGWDLRNERTQRKHEVKWDAAGRSPWKSYGSVRQPTGNIFIEYKNPTTDIDTGIMASESNIWAHIVKVSDTFVEDSSFEYSAWAYVFSLPKLREFCKEVGLRSRETTRDIGKKGKPNAKGWLLPIDMILSNSKECGLILRADITPYLYSSQKF